MHKENAYTGTHAHKNPQIPGQKKHPVELPQDVQYYWRGGDILEWPAYKNPTISGTKQAIFTILRHTQAPPPAEIQPFLPKFPKIKTGN